MSWVKTYRFGRYVVMFSKAPFFFSRWPTLRWKSLAWGRYEFKVIRLSRHVGQPHPTPPTSGKPQENTDG